MSDKEYVVPQRSQLEDANFDLYCAYQRISDLEQQLASAHREGWEQAKRECAFIVQNYDHNPDRDGDWADQLDEVIATMEYKGEPND